MQSEAQRPSDRRGRSLVDLRVSVTDRCNFRCGYCMPRTHYGSGHQFLPRAELLSFEEIARVARVASTLGVRKVRLTGGEPLLRAELYRLVAMLAAIPDLEIALTTNGSLLARHAQSLAEAGLTRVTVSLDALDPVVFRKNADADYEVSDVLEGIQAASRVGLGPIKVNAVVRRGVNDDQVLPLARYFKGTPHVMRFIEYMDVGITNGWERSQVMGAQEIVATIAREFPLRELPPRTPGEVAQRYGYTDDSGEIGVVSSVTQPFCGTCTRLRLSSEGKLYTCLFATLGHDIREELRGGSDDAAITEFVRALWQGREDRYSELRSERTRGLRRIEMSYIGG